MPHKSKKKNRHWSLWAYNRQKTVLGVLVLTHIPITLISPPLPLPLPPHPLQPNTKTRHGPQNRQKLVPLGLLCPCYWADQRNNSHKHLVTSQSPDQTTTSFRSCCHICLTCSHHWTPKIVLCHRFRSLMSLPATECWECCHQGNDWTSTNSQGQKIQKPQIGTQ